MVQNRSSAVMQQRAEPNDSLISIAEAREQGLLWYFTGKPCAKGHIAKRSISNRECRRCVDDRAARKRADDPETVRAKDRISHRKRRDRRNAQSRASHARHREKRRAYERARYGGDRRLWQITQAKQWAKENPGRRNEIVAARRAHIKRATPPWLTAEDKRQIREIYRKARSYGPGVMHVDHIIPLRGRLICGLHVPGNLRIIPRLANIRKGNRHGAK